MDFIIKGQYFCQVVLSKTNMWMSVTRTFGNRSRFKRHNRGAHSQVGKIGLREARVRRQVVGSLWLCMRVASLYISRSGITLSFPQKLDISTVMRGDEC